jgi:hypothetical protein
MIQRKQTLFLIVAFVLTLVCLSSQVASLYGNDGLEFARVYNLWLSDGQGNHSFKSVPLFVCLLLSSVTSLVSIFLYTKRKVQALMCLANMVLLLCWYVLLAVLPQSTGGMIHLLWPVVLPAVSIVFIFLARKGVLADEKLVRSLDRIR